MSRTGEPSRGPTEREGLRHVADLGRSGAPIPCSSACPLCRVVGKSNARRAAQQRGRRRKGKR